MATTSTMLYVPLYHKLRYIAQLLIFSLAHPDIVFDHVLPTQFLLLWFMAMHLMGKRGA